MWETGGVKSILIDEDGWLGADLSRALEIRSSVIVSSLTLSGVDETDTLDLNVGGTVDGKHLGVRVEDEWIEVTISLVVTGV